MLQLFIPYSRSCVLRRNVDLQAIRFFFSRANQAVALLTHFLWATKRTVYCPTQQPSLTPYSQLKSLNYPCHCRYNSTLSLRNKQKQQLWIVKKQLHCCNTHIKKVMKDFHLLFFPIMWLISFRFDYQKGSLHYQAPALLHLCTLINVIVFQRQKQTLSKGAVTQNEWMNSCLNHAWVHLLFLHFSVIF